MRNEKLKMLPLFLVALLAVGMMGCGTSVPSGHRAVFFSKFSGGTEMGQVYAEGFNWHFPWNSMIVYQIQTQERKEDLTVLSSDGATIRIQVSILYHPNPEKIDSLQVSIGRDYYAVALAPSIRGIARAVAGKFKPEEIYSTKREELQLSIVEQLTTEMAGRNIVVENVVVRDVQIPAKISEAINFKLTADQEAQKMQFTIAKEKLEAERKRIEAKGIADFQKIVAAGITTSYLKWKGIEATQKIAESPNSKVIIIGNDSGEMPLILGGNN